jgi:hypothetical protein
MENRRDRNRVRDGFGDVERRAVDMESEFRRWTTRVCAQSRALCERAHELRQEQPALRSESRGMVAKSEALVERIHKHRGRGS